jgi:hypothetical protein
MRLFSFWQDRPISILQEIILWYNEELQSCVQCWKICNLIPYNHFIFPLLSVKAYFIKIHYKYNYLFLFELYYWLNLYLKLYFLDRLLIKIVYKTCLLYLSFTELLLWKKLIQYQKFLANKNLYYCYIYQSISSFCFHRYLMVH